jgi:hypothetical protein
MCSFGEYIWGCQHKYSCQLADDVEVRFNSTASLSRLLKTARPIRIKCHNLRSNSRQSAHYSHLTTRIRYFIDMISVLFPKIVDVGLLVSIIAGHDRLFSAPFFIPHPLKPLSVGGGCLFTPGPSMIRESRLLCVFTNNKGVIVILRNLSKWSRLIR